MIMPILGSLLALFPILLGEFSAPSPVPAADGCVSLHAAAAPVCRARVRCTAPPARLAAAEEAFRRCAAGGKVTREEVAALVAGFSGPRAFRCCAGNALAARYPPAPATR